MARRFRLFITSAVVAVAVSGGAARAFACGSNGYSYAGVAAAGRAFGISASVSAVSGFPVLNGHVAAWVGVGGPGEGQDGTDEWLEIGLSGFPAVTGSDLYYEVSEPSGFPTYHQVASNLPVGKAFEVGVLEMHGRPNWWRVWLNGEAVSKPIRLPHSHGRWAPVATAESWDGGAHGVCNTFLYHFRRIRVADAPGGGWHGLSGGYPIQSSVTRVRRSRGGGAFLAAEGDQAIRLLRTLRP
jgi:hypothetical protein